MLRRWWDWRRRVANSSAVVELGAAATRNMTAVQIAGARPFPRTLAFLSWLSTLLAARIANVPLKRTTRYYFAQSGNDSPNTGTSINSPFLTLTKAQALLTAATTVGDIRLSFNRGDVWRAAPGLVAKSNVTIDTYGNGDKPVFSSFIYRYLAGGGGWTSDSLGSYFRTETHDLAWVKYVGGDSIALDMMLERMSTQVACDNGTQCFFMDPVNNRLYVNVGVDPNTVSLEGSLGGVSTTKDMLLFGDNIRLQEIRFEGWGIRESDTPRLITNAVNNGSGLIRITAASHGLTTGKIVLIAAIGGTVEANGNWTVTVINANTVDLQGSTFTNAYTSGGTIRIAASQTYGISCEPQSATDEIVVVGCEVYYTGYHAIGALNIGITTIYNCTVGHIRLGPGGQTPMVSFASAGGQETFFFGNTIYSGNLWEDGARRQENTTAAIYSHTVTGTAVLLVNQNNTIRAGPYSCLNTSCFSGVPDAAGDITACNAFIINERFDEGSTRRIGIFGTNGFYQVMMNCFYRGLPNPANANPYPHACGQSPGAWTYNCTFIDGGSASGGVRNLFDPVIDNGRFYNCWFEAHDSGGIFKSFTNASTFPNVRVYNSVFACYDPVGGEDQSGCVINLSNVAGNIHGNAIYAIDPTNAAYNAWLGGGGAAGTGAFNDPEKVNLSSAPNLAVNPVAGNQLYGKAIGMLLPEYNSSGDPRGGSLVIGPRAITEAGSVPASTTSQLQVWTQPTDVSPASAITPAIRIEAQNKYGDTNPLYTGAVTLAISTNPGSGTLSGTTTRNAVNGFAVFNDLKINNSGTGYKLQATASGLTPVITSAFNVNSSFDPSQITAGTVLLLVHNLAGNRYFKDVGNTAGQEASVGDTVKGIKSIVGPNASYATGVVLASNGLPGGTNVAFQLATALASLGDFYAAVIGTRATGQNFSPFGHDNTGGANPSNPYIGIYSDNNVYFNNDGGGTQNGAVAQTGRFLGIFSRTGTTAKYRGTGGISITLSGAVSTPITINQLLHSTSGGNSDAATRYEEELIVNADITGSGDEASFLSWVASNYSGLSLA